MTSADVTGAERLRVDATALLTILAKGSLNWAGRIRVAMVGAGPSTGRPSGRVFSEHAHFSLDRGTGVAYIMSVLI